MKRGSSAGKFGIWKDFISVQTGYMQIQRNDSQVRLWSIILCTYFLPSPRFYRSNHVSVKASLTGDDDRSSSSSGKRPRRRRLSITTRTSLNLILLTVVYILALLVASYVFLHFYSWFGKFSLNTPVVGRQLYISFLPFTAHFSPFPFL